MVAVGLRLPGDSLEARITKRVNSQFASGLLDEIRSLWQNGVPSDAGPFGGLVYRQAVEHLQGVRDEPATRDLIIRENRRYARRQLTWFRKEPGLQWLEMPGEWPDCCVRVLQVLDQARLD